MVEKERETGEEEEVRRRGRAERRREKTNVTTDLNSLFPLNDFIV